MARVVNEKFSQSEYHPIDDMSSLFIDIRRLEGPRVHAWPIL